MRLALPELFEMSPRDIKLFLLDSASFLLPPRFGVVLDFALECYLLTDEFPEDLILRSDVPTLDLFLESGDFASNWELYVRLLL